MIFIDTSFLYALADKGDKNHHRAVVLFEKALSGGREIVLHNYIIIECMALFDRRLGRNAAVDLGRTVRNFRIHWILQEEHSTAESEFAAAKPSRGSFVDMVSFVVMRSLGIDHCLAFDAHFTEQGFTIYK